MLAAHALYEDSRGGPFPTSLVLRFPWLVAASLQSLPLFMWLLPMAPCPHLAIFISSYENTNRIGCESESRSVVPDSLQPRGPYSPWNSPGQNPGVGSLSLLQGIFPTEGLNSGLPHCRQILYQLSHKGCPRVLEWVAYPFSRGSSQPRNRTGVSCIAGGFFTN